ncbi:MULTISPECIES: hypothetical protein [unclassified Bradyrhizobium]|uniref:hypothetical protein n=1 Tax=unclassified Bradyrhizobium TaxID=2631580 RepID=UPI003393551D
MAGLKFTRRIETFADYEMPMSGRNNRNMLFDPKGHHFLDVEDMHFAFTQFHAFEPGSRLLCVKWIASQNHFLVNEFEML